MMISLVPGREPSVKLLILLALVCGACFFIIELARSRQMQQQPFNSLARKPGFSRSMLAFVVFLGIALFFLLSEHRIHALGWLPLLLLAACPLLHMFHHGGHGSHGSHGSQGGNGKHSHADKGEHGPGATTPGQLGDPALQQAGDTI